MVPTYATVPLQGCTIVIVHVETHHFRCVQALSYATKATTWTTTEAHVIDIIGRCKAHHAELVVEVGTHSLLRVTTLCSDTQVYI